MANVSVFNFGNTAVQVLNINNEAWFIASEIAAVFGYLKASDLTRVLDDDEKGTHNMRTLGGNQDVSIINESGLYHAAFKSRKAEVQKFRKWVTAEVLPTIRKTGSYPTQKRSKRALPAPMFSEHEIYRFAVVVHYLALATQQLEELSHPLQSLGAYKQGISAWTLWDESQVWIRNCRQTLERAVPAMQNEEFKEWTQKCLQRI